MGRGGLSAARGGVSEREGEKESPAARLATKAPSMQWPRAQILGPRNPTAKNAVAQGPHDASTYKKMQV